MNILRFSLSLLMTLLATVACPQARTIMVKAGDAASFLDAISEANATNAQADGAERLFILIPNGFYDLGEKALTTITGHNISLVGESTDQTIIRNAPPVEKEGIGTTATILIKGTGTYLQDLTLRNDLDYYHSGAAGRAVCLQDKGNYTICKRVKMLSYQDTYYSYCEDAQHYMEDSEIHGTVDFICGAGDVYFNHCVIVTERRNADGSGRCVIAAPRTQKTDWGYVFDQCTIGCNVSEFQYARGWNVTPRCVWLNTRLLQPELLLHPRFDPNGMRTVQNFFKEYGTTDATGRNITPASNIVTFTCNADTNTVETIFSRKEAQAYSPKAVFPQWRPDKKVYQLEQQALKLWKDCRR